MGRRGGALLAVLWLSAALSVICLSLAMSVRAEVERAAGAVDSARAYYLAQGAVERFILHLGWAQFTDPNAVVGGRFRHGIRRLRWQFETGVVDLVVTGESGKLHLPTAPPEALLRLFQLLGVESGRAQQVTAGIVERRSLAAGRGAATQTNLSPDSSFSSILPSFLQLEDLLMLNGVDPEVYYGWWEREQESRERARLLERGGLSGHLTLLEGGAINVNYASPEVMRAVGVPGGVVEGILQTRENGPITDAQLAAFGLGTTQIAAGMRLAAGGSLAYTVRATAQLNDRAVKRTVAALVRLGRDRTEPPVGVVRWHPAAY